jgi:hypothetical protein
VVAQPLRRAEELVTFWLCVAPLRLGGLRGKKSTPSVWLGGTGEFIAVGKQEQEQRGAQEFIAAAARQRYGFVLDRIGCFTSYVGIRTWFVNGLMAVYLLCKCNKICSPCVIIVTRCVMGRFL